MLKATQDTIDQAKETFMAQWTEVIKLAELPEGAKRAVIVGDAEILLVRFDGAVHAMGNRCGHMNASLAEGTLEGKVLTCAFHSARFDVTTGKKVSDAVVLPPPAIDKAPPEMLPYLQKAGRLSAPIRTHDCPRYEVMVEGDAVKVRID
jgi:nitrite reductase/ring-hydroxylating ferredoxin subunit